MGIQSKFQEHISQYGISYGTKEEYEFRMEIFAKNDAFIRESNLDKKNTFVLNHNKFSTLTKDEYRKLLGKKQVKN
jgi:hypothetical protein